MQEDLEPFGVKIESNFGAQAETEARGLGQALGADERSGPGVEVERGIREGSLPEAMKVPEGKVVAVRAKHPVVGNRVGAIPLDGEAARLPDLNAHSCGPRLPLGGGGGGQKERGQNKECNEE